MDRECNFEVNAGGGVGVGFLANDLKRNFCFIVWAGERRVTAA